MLLGDKFPELSVITTHGPLNIPGDYQGKWVVLFSHPADFTPVCTTEFVSFAKKAKEFKKLNTELVGFSIDQVFSHIKWVQWIKDKLDVDIPFPIIAGTETTANMLGMLHEAKGANTVRTVFVIDDKGIIRLILTYPQEIGRNINEILRAVEALQISDKDIVATPANWPENELIGKAFIIPPAKSIKEAEKRIKEYKNFDWWFCYKE